MAMTAKFVAAYKAGKDDQARALYPVARMHWERIETVAEYSVILIPSSTFERPIWSPVESGPAGIDSKRSVAGARQELRAAQQGRACGVLQ